MTRSLQNTTLSVTLEKEGSRKYAKMSYPIHSGKYSEVESGEYLFHFNLNNEIIRAKRKGEPWPHPHEWLKRTIGNDWIYYSTGGYTGVFEATGEYYLPNLPYLSNNLLGGNPFKNDVVVNLISEWPDIISRLANNGKKLPLEIQRFFSSVLASTPQKLSANADELFRICGGRSTVLPPDSRHVDYNVIPLTIASGCLYKCSFCEVKNNKPFVAKTLTDIRQQMAGLRSVYNDDLCNYNSLFLGEHDALQAGPEIIIDTLTTAYNTFDFADTYLWGCNAFLFGSVTSLLNTPESLFGELQALPYLSYINVGLESADQTTLDILGKPITSDQVRDAFSRIQQINDRYSKIEVTANFVYDETLPENHLSALLELVREGVPKVKSKGCVYLSPLKFGKPSRAQIFGFNRLKVLSRVPTFLYVIQRL